MNPGDLPEAVDEIRIVAPAAEHVALLVQIVEQHAEIIKANKAIVAALACPALVALKKKDDAK